MIPYFVVAGIFALAAVLFPGPRPNRVAWVSACVLLILFTGLRHKVGMDWNNYLIMADRMSQRSLVEAFDLAEPAYALLLWGSAQLGLGVYGANLVGNSIFCVGLFKCASKTPAPWLAVLIALPLLVVVVSMSAARQTIAIGVLLWLVAIWRDTGLIKRVLITLLAASFHFSAIFFLAFVAWDLKLKPTWRISLGLAMGAGLLGFLVFSGSGGYYDDLYVSGQTQMTYSPGAIQHVMLNGLPALAVLLPARIRSRMLPFPLLAQMAVLAIALIPLALVFSQAAGRMTLYLFPVSMFALSGAVTLIQRAEGRALGRTVIAMAMVGVLAMWLNFANSSHAHNPYSNALLMDRSELHL